MTEPGTVVRDRDHARKLDQWLSDQDRRRAKRLPVDPRYDRVLDQLVLYDWGGGDGRRIPDPVSPPKRAEYWLKLHDAQRDEPQYKFIRDHWLIHDWRDSNDVAQSRHLSRELDAIDRGRSVEPGAPVPRCGCYLCTGIPERLIRRDKIDRTRRRRPTRALRPALDLDAARAVPILAVAAMLGIPHKRGLALCPFHADTNPSFHLNPKKNAAFCNACGGAGTGSRW